MIEKFPSEVLIGELDKFRNAKDSDIETFLREKAITFEKRHWCSTYLIIDADEFTKNCLKIEGYFTLSNKVFYVSSDVGTTRRRKLFNGMINGDNGLPVILIGQLGKFISNDRVSEISMQEILDIAFEMIDSVNEIIPCRCVLLECKEASSEDKEEEKYSEKNYIKNTWIMGFHRYKKKVTLFSI